MENKLATIFGIADQPKLGRYFVYGFWLLVVASIVLISRH